MGEEIQYSRFNKTDYQQFISHLKRETALLKSWFDDHKFSSASLMAGYELETWLIDQTGQPVAINETFLEKANNPLLSPELAKFNVELNVDPQRLSHNVLSTFERQLDKLWQQCSATASSLDAKMLGIGILPTLQDSDLTLKNISLLNRYKALNEQVLSQRNGIEIELNINGRDHLQVSHKDVMLEAAATSLQIHIHACGRKHASLFLSRPFQPGVTVVLPQGRCIASVLALIMCAILCLNVFRKTLITSLSCCRYITKQRSIGLSIYACIMALSGAGTGL